MRIGITTVLVISFSMMTACAASSSPQNNLTPSAASNCSPHLLGNNAVPTEKIARAIYFAVYQGVLDRENPGQEVDVQEQFQKDGWEVEVLDRGRNWEVFPTHPELAGLVGGGFSVTIQKCDGAVVNAGYVR